MVAGTADDPVTSCTRCGSMRRHGTVFAGAATGTAVASSPESLAEEADPDYHAGRRRPAARERRVGMDRTRVDGIERSRRREYDRKGNWYEETVLNPDGTLYYRDAEPLTDHVGHGSESRQRREDIGTGWSHDAGSRVPDRSPKRYES
jgi:hypothetical protein